MMNKLRYDHSFETHTVNGITTQDGIKILIIGKDQIPVHPECAMQVGDSLDKYLVNNIQLALESGVATVLIHSNPIKTCERCPFNGNGCPSVASGALEDNGLYKIFKTEI